MSADGVSGAKNQPQFLGSGAPATAADMNILANYAALVGNAKNGTDADRQALAGKDVWNGLIYTCLDTKVTWVRLAGAWTPIGLRPVNSQPPTIIHHGQTRIITDANGLFNCAFDVNFPNACDRVIAMCATVSYTGGVVVTGRTSSFWSGRVAVTVATALDMDWIAVGR